MLNVAEVLRSKAGTRAHIVLDEGLADGPTYVVKWEGRSSDSDAFIRSWALDKAASQRTQRLVLDTKEAKDVGDRRAIRSNTRAARKALKWAMGEDEGSPGAQALFDLIGAWISEGSP